MGRVRVNARVQAFGGAVLGVSVAAVGASLVWSPGWGLMLWGVCVTVLALLYVDVRPAVDADAAEDPDSATASARRERPPYAQQVRPVGSTRWSSVPRDVDSMQELGGS